MSRLRGKSPTNPILPFLIFLFVAGVAVIPLEYLGVINLVSGFGKNVVRTSQSPTQLKVIEGNRYKSIEI